MTRTKVQQASTEVKVVVDGPDNDHRRGPVVKEPKKWKALEPKGQHWQLQLHAFSPLAYAALSIAASDLDPRLSSFSSESGQHAHLQLLLASQRITDQ